jgi:type III restriction enzyme
MAERNDFADEIGKWLLTTKDTRLKKSEVLVIHVKERGRDLGEVQDRDLEDLRKMARDIDLPGNRIKVIVSVLMLREGWDVRGVTVVLGLRPFTSKAKILSEQAVGRGLRLMQGISPDRTQTLEVMGTRAFEDFVRLLETEGVGIKMVTTPPAPPVNVEPVLEKIAYDITIPLTRPVYMHDYKRLSLFDPLALDPVYDQEELDKPIRIRLRMEFATTETEVHQADILSGPPPPAQELLASITNKIIRFARLPGGFAQPYPLIRTYTVQRCFGLAIDIDRAEIRAHLRFPLLQDGIARYLARKLGELTAEKRTIEFENAAFKLSHTTHFIWRRNLPLLACRKTVFNLVATYNDYEQAFARFLDRCPDVPRFAALGTTEQESGTRFRVDFLKPSGAIGFY